MRFHYGLVESNIDVTDVCNTRLIYDNIISIPSNDHNRSAYFSDPHLGKKKLFIILYEDDHIDVFGEEYAIQINITTRSIVSINMIDTYNRLSNIHSALQINHGTFNDEFPEQLMAANFLSGKEKVLEIGGNIGRNSLVIAHLLGKHEYDRLVVLECDPVSAEKLRENRDLNQFNFHIEDSALSKRKLIQRGWDTLASDTLLDGYKWVNTITLDELRAKYNIAFDTLVLDCEGAFYYILMDMPEILDNINLIIMENDYYDINHKKYVDDVLRNNQFQLSYVEPGGWGPCSPNFFEVWKRV
jgi:FkbM family methyltransferase